MVLEQDVHHVDAQIQHLYIWMRRRRCRQHTIRNYNEIRMHRCAADLVFPRISHTIRVCFCPPSSRLLTQRVCFPLESADKQNIPTLCVWMRETKQELVQLTCFFTNSMEENFAQLSKFMLILLFGS